VSVDPLGPIEAVCVSEGNVDPAIDVAASNLDEYLRTRDPKHLRFKPGMQPTKYVLRPISAMYVMDKLENMPRGSKLAMAFSVACHEVRVPAGEPLRPKRLNADPSYGVEIASDEWIETVRNKCRLSAVIEMGALALRRASLRPDELGPFDWPATVSGAP
jgi:hypothetical protein